VYSVQFDIFCDQNYPWASRRRNTYDVPLHSDTTDAEYLAILTEQLSSLKQHQPQLVVYQAGVDCLLDDALGKMSLSRDTLGRRNNMVYSFALELNAPLLITMGGGYAKPDIMKSVVCHADVYRAAAFRLSAFK
jgi:acetoin utilization deacetylase AcuC-like enzyme